MMRNGIQHSYVSIRNLALGSEGMISGLLHYLRVTENRFTPGTPIYNMVLHSLIKAKEDQTAINVFKTLMSHGYRPNDVTCNIMIDCCSISRSFKSAQRLIAMMIRYGYPPQIQAYTSLVKLVLASEDFDEALNLLNQACSEGIQLDAVVFNTIIDVASQKVNAFLERKALASSLNDTMTIVNKLHQMLNAVVGIFIVVIWLLILKVATTHFLIFISSQVLLIVFVFGNTCKTTFEAIIFLFVMHPYDIGDRYQIHGVQMVVEKMTMLTTVFKRSDDQKVMYANNVLATKSIGNFSRSGAMGDEVAFSINISTPRDKIDEMRKQIKKYARNKSDYWLDETIVVVKGVEDMNTLKMVVWPKHVVNYHNMSQRWERRSELILEMIRVFKDLDIDFKLPALNVNITNNEGVRQF